MTLRQLIRKAMKSTFPPLNAEQLGEDVGVSGRMVFYYLAGEKEPSESVRKKLEQLAQRGQS